MPTSAWRGTAENNGAVLGGPLIAKGAIDITAQEND
jgi:hypothetical protein